MKLVMDVISDVICPWCYIGKRRREKAIAAFEGKHDVQVPCPALFRYFEVAPAELYVKAEKLI